jgi:hypothetical protein
MERIVKLLSDVAGELRVMYAIHTDSDGIVAHIAVPGKGSVTETFYRYHVLTAVVKALH